MTLRPILRRSALSLATLSYFILGYLIFEPTPAGAITSPHQHPTLSPRHAPHAIVQHPLGTHGATSSQPPRLSALWVTTAGREMYPTFRPQQRHYAAGCPPDQPVTVSATADPNLRLSIAGRQRQSGETLTVRLDNLKDDDAILLDLLDATGNLNTYVIQCLPDDFPHISAEVIKPNPQRLIAFSTRVQGDRSSLEGKSYLVVIDQNGVPRFHRAIDRQVMNFKPHHLENLTWSYGEWVETIASYTAATRRSGRVTILDHALEPVRQLTTTEALKHTNLHDVAVRDNSNVVLMAYEPAVRDLTSLNRPDAEPLYSDQAGTEDSAIEEITPDGTPALLWNSWDHVALEDCTQHNFPRDYAHINSLQAYDGDVIASLRGCSQVLRIDGQTGAVLWRLGRSNLPTQQWKDRGGTPPLKIINDPHGEFCAQHSARMVSPTNIILFDNGGHCLINPATGKSGRTGGKFSRAVEYRLDLAAHTATFVRHHSLRQEFSHYARSQGNVQPTTNGNWLISWGRGAWDDDPSTGTPPDVSATEVEPATNREIWNLTVKVKSSLEPVEPVLAYPITKDQLGVPQAQRQPRITWVDTVSKTRHSATLLLTTTPATPTPPAYLRYRPLPDDAWSPGRPVTGITTTLHGLEPDTHYEIQTSLDPHFPDLTTRRITLTTPR